MKILRSVSIFAIFALIATTISCSSDDEPKQEEVEDLEAPVVTITAPADGSTVSSLDATVSITIQYEVTDDIELSSVIIEFDGTQVAEINEFTDFRVFNGEQIQESVGDGEYTITITATDNSGKTGTASSTFTKVTSNPYTPLDNEVVYMAFEGNYLEAVNEVEATVVGTPDFAGEGMEGDNAYAGAADSYLTFDVENLITTELTVSLWMRVNNDPDRGGVLVMGPEDTENENYPDVQNLRTSGFRFFREAAGDNQIFKVNFGTGESDVWLDGGEFAQIVPNTDEWLHFGFIIGETTAAIYVNGVKAAENIEHAGLDMTGCNLLSIMSGAPRFTEWGHAADLSDIDELKIFDKALTEAELSTIAGIEIGDPVWNPDPGLTPVDGPDATELLYMSFDADFTITGVSSTATTIGTPTVASGGVSGSAYVGAADSYLTIPTDGLLNDEFSASFWVNVNNTPDRGGIIVIGPEDTENASYPDVQNKRTNGFRFFREDAGGEQRFKINVGDGTADTWVDGGEYADIAVDAGWRHVAFTLSATKGQVYLNGILVTSVDLTGLDWTGCDILSFGSGAPRFTEWGHLSDESMFDELRIYSGVLNPAQIAALKAVGD